MAKICLILPGNTLHANHLTERMEEMDRERYGLQVFRKFGIPGTVFFQGLDLMVKPWLKDEVKIPGSIEWGQAPFSHTLIPLVGDGWRPEMKYGFKGPVPVTFFSEFYSPKPEQIPTPFTLVLAGNSILYSAGAELSVLNPGDVMADPFPKSNSIKYQGKVGLMLRDECFGGFLKAFFLFQRYPLLGTHPEGRDCLAELIEEVRKIASMSEDEVILCPIDLEAPWIGSCFGALVWEIFFEELQRQNLKSVFIPLSAELDRLAETAVQTDSRPHRELTKWTHWESQINLLTELNAIKTGDKRQDLVKMIATGSDIFAAFDLKLREARKKILLPGCDKRGNRSEIPISFNQEVIDIQLAAKWSLQRSVRFQDELVRIKNPGYLARLFIEMARTHKL